MTGGKFLEHLKFKWNSFNTKKKLLVYFLLLILILPVLFLMINDNSKTDIITYSTGCVEVFINNILNSSECTSEREKIKQRSIHWSENTDVNLSRLNLSII